MAKLATKADTGTLIGLTAVIGAGLAALTASKDPTQTTIQRRGEAVSTGMKAVKVAAILGGTLWIANQALGGGKSLRKALSPG